MSLFIRPFLYVTESENKIITDERHCDLPVV